MPNRPVAKYFGRFILLVVVRGELFRKWDREIEQGDETWPTNGSSNGKRA
jgi:hypothetical protein